MATESKELQTQEVEKQEITANGAERTRARKAYVPRADILTCSGTRHHDCTVKPSNRASQSQPGTACDSGGPPPCKNALSRKGVP